MLFLLPEQLPNLGHGWTTSMEVRGRYETRDDLDFDSSVEDRTSLFLTRGRLGVTYSLAPNTTGRIVYQFTGSNLDPSSGSSTSMVGQDLIEANIVRRASGSTLTLGRQKVNIGGQRLIGALEWANSSRSWLGMRLDAGTWGFFWGELESNPVPNPNVQVAFVSSKNVVGDTTLIYKYDSLPAQTTSHTTLDHRFVRDLGAAQITAEGAYQWGRRGGMDQDAWAGTLRGEFSVSPMLKLYAEGNIATGGSGSKNRTFDNLYPTNHLYYGMMDLQGWSNMKGYAIGANWQASNGLTMDVSYQDFSLYDKTDGWYGATGAINRVGGTPMIDPTGMSGSHVGSELDLVVKYNAGRGTSIEGGVAFFSPGQFVRSIVGGSSSRSTFGYVQVGYRL